MISDDFIDKVAELHGLQRRIRRSIDLEDSESFAENYLKIVECSPELYECLESLCGFLDQFIINIGGEVSVN